MAENEYLDNKTADQLKNMMQSGMKVVNVRDLAGRIETLYEAPIAAKLNDPCVRTRYKFFDGAGGSSRSVMAWEEEVVAWPGYEIIETGAGNDFDLVP